MQVVDFEIGEHGLVSYRNSYVLELTFTHDDGAMTEIEHLVFPSEFKADAVACVNTLRAANDFIEENGSTPGEAEVAGYEMYCNGASNFGLDCWPADHNGDYYGSLDLIAVTYYNAEGTAYGVKQVIG